MHNCRVIERGSTVEINQSILDALTDEQKKAIEEATTPEELAALAKKTGYDLTDEQLRSLSGGLDLDWLPGCNEFHCKDLL